MQSDRSHRAASKTESYSQPANKSGPPAFPFDLTNLVSFQFDQLKLAIEYIAHQQGEQQTLINELLIKQPQGAQVANHSHHSVHQSMDAAVAQPQPGPVLVHDNVDNESFQAINHLLPGEESLPMTQSDENISPKDFNDELGDGSPGATSALMQSSQLNRMVGSLHEKLESVNSRLNDHDNRMVALESKGRNSDEMFENLQKTVQDMRDTVNKLDNTNKVRKVLENTELSNESIDLILGTLNEMQEKIISDTNVKLEAYVTIVPFKDMQSQNEALTQRIAHAEAELEIEKAQMKENTERIENSRKRIHRLISDVEIMKRKTKSAMDLAQNAQDTAGEKGGLSLEDLANVEISGDGMERMTKMLQRLEQNLSRRINNVEDQIDRINALEDAVDQIKTDGVVGKPGSSKDIGIEQSDIEQWHKNTQTAEELAELIKQVQIDLTILDGSKLKADVSTLMKAQQTFVLKEQTERMETDVKKIRMEIADNSYEVQNAKDLVSKVEKIVEINHKEIKQSLQAARAKADKNEQKIEQNKSGIGHLDEKIRSFIKNAALGGNTSYGEGNLVQEIEDNIKKLRDDLDDLSKMSQSDSRIIKNDLYNRLSKNDGTVLENRILQQVEDVLAQVKEQFLEKEVLRKRFNGIDKTVRHLNNEVTALKEKEPEEDTGMFTKRVMPPTNCASCEKNINNLLTSAADHQNWNKLPFREPNERIARYGAGFSKILNQMKPSESAAQIRADHSAMDMEQSRNFSQHGATEAGGMVSQPAKLARRSPSVAGDQEQQNANTGLLDFNSSTMSPINSNRNTIDYGHTMNMAQDDQTTAHMTNVQGAYKSAVKMRQGKRGSVGASPQPQMATMKPIVNSTWDTNESALPKVKGAQKSHRQVI